MDALHRLISDDFFSLYANTASSLAERLKMRPVIDYQRLETAQIGWEEEIAEGLSRNLIDETDSRFWIKVLGSVGVHLCRAACVHYVLPDARPSDSLFTQQQTLLQYYPAEYTAMEFVRRLHMEIYFDLARIQPLKARPALVTLDPNELAERLRQIRDRPEAAREYWRLLHLPE